MTKLTALTEDSSPSGSDLAYTVKDPAGTPLSRKATWTNIVAAGLSAPLTDLGSRWTAASTSGPASLDFREDADNGTNRVRLIAPSTLSADLTATLPDATGTLAVIDTSAYGSGWNGSTKAPTQDAVYDKIQTIGTSVTVISEQTLGSAAAQIDFTSIPQTYKHLRIEGRARCSTASNDIYIAVQVGNGSVDTGSNYRGVGWQSSVSATVFDYNNTSRSDITFGRIPGSTADADVWSLVTFEIQDYTGTTYWRTMKGEANVHVSSTSAILYRALGEWKNKASAIDTIRVKPASGNFITGSQLRLIGIPAG